MLENPSRGTPSVRGWMNKARQDGVKAQPQNNSPARRRIGLNRNEKEIIEKIGAR